MPLLPSPRFAVPHPALPHPAPHLHPCGSPPSRPASPSRRCPPPCPALRTPRPPPWAGGAGRCRRCPGCSSPYGWAAAGGVADGVRVSVHSRQHIWNSVGKGTGGQAVVFRLPQLLRVCRGEVVGCPNQPGPAPTPAQHSAAQHSAAHRNAPDATAQHGAAHGVRNILSSSLALRPLYHTAAPHFAK